MVRIEIITRKNHIKVHSIITGISFFLPPSLADFLPLAGKNVQKLGGAVMPQFWDTLPQRRCDPSNQFHFTIYGRKWEVPRHSISLSRRRICSCLRRAMQKALLPLLKMGEKKTVLWGVPGERSVCRCSVVSPLDGTQ